MEYIRRLDAVVHSLDKFGEPVANLNMKGKSRYTTRLGGLCGITIYSLMAWFVVVRYQKMMNRIEPVIYEVTQGMNLMADDSPTYDLKEQNFKFGLGFYGTKIQWIYFDEEKYTYLQIYEDVSLDLTNLLDVNR